MDKIIENSKNGLDEIYNPVTKCTPKTKQIFKVERHQGRNIACASAGCLKKNQIGLESSHANMFDEEPASKHLHEYSSLEEENWPLESEARHQAWAKQPFTGEDEVDGLRSGFQLQQFPNLAVGQTLFGGADSQQLKLTAGIEKCNSFKDGIDIGI